MSNCNNSCASLLFKNGYSYVTFIAYWLLYYYNINNIPYSAVVQRVLNWNYRHVIMFFLMHFDFQKPFYVFQSISNAKRCEKFYFSYLSLYKELTRPYFLYKTYMVYFLFYFWLFHNCPVDIFLLFLLLIRFWENYPCLRVSNETWKLFLHSLSRCILRQNRWMLYFWNTSSGLLCLLFYDEHIKQQNMS